MKYALLHRTLFLASIALLLVLPGAAGGAASEPSAVGVNFISPEGDWQEIRETFRLMNPTLAKVQIPLGFGTEPHHVEDLIADMGGRGTVILRTEDCKPFPDEVRYELVTRGFMGVVRRHPDVEFWVEVGNEPEYCGLDLEEYLRGQLQTLSVVGRDTAAPNLHWMASLPIGIARVQRAVEVLHDSGYDAYGIHLYGHYTLFDEPEQADAYRWLIEHSDKPIFITEAGINDPGTSDKAEQYVDFAESVPNVVRGVAFWTISMDGRFPNYQITPEMARTMAERASTGDTPVADPRCHWFHVTRQTVCEPFLSYWQSAGLELGDPGISYRESVALFGLPVSEARYETNQDGDHVLTQWFERSAFELHPNNRPPYQVQLRRVGYDLWSLQEVP